MEANKIIKHQTQTSQKVLPTLLIAASIYLLILRFLCGTTICGVDINSESYWICFRVDFIWLGV